MHPFRYLSFMLFAGVFASCGNSQDSTGSTADTAKAKSTSGTDTATKTILFFGNSLTAGYGLDDPSTEAFPSLIEQKIDSLNLPYRVINGGLSGETTAGGKSRIDWLLKTKIDVFVLELGANDGLRGLSVSETAKNLQAIFDKVKAKYPNVKLALTGMQMPPSMGQEYTSSFKAVFPAVAQKNNAALVPFLLQGVGGDRKLNQGDGIHPTASGHKILAENVWKVLEGIL